MEMGAAQLAVRIVGSIGRIDQGHLRTGKLTDEEWPRLSEAIEKLRTISLHIDESFHLFLVSLVLYLPSVYQLDSFLNK